MISRPGGLSGPARILRLGGLECFAGRRLAAGRFGFGRFSAGRFSLFRAGCNVCIRAGRIRPRARARVRARVARRALAPQVGRFGHGFRLLGGARSAGFRGPGSKANASSRSDSGAVTMTVPAFRIGAAACLSAGCRPRPDRSRRCEPAPRSRSARCSHRKPGDRASPAPSA